MMLRQHTYIVMRVWPEGRFVCGLRGVLYTSREMIINAERVVVALLKIIDAGGWWLTCHLPTRSRFFSSAYKLCIFQWVLWQVPILGTSTISMKAVPLDHRAKTNDKHYLLPSFVLSNSCTSLDALLHSLEIPISWEIRTTGWPKINGNA